MATFYTNRMKLNRVLLVDDDNTSNYITEAAIKRIHFCDEVVIKTDAASALEYLEKECLSLNQFPDLILLDLKMPGMDGFEFIEAYEMACSKIKHEIVIVILTSSQNGDDLIRLRKLGKFDVLNKPLTSVMLEDIYHKYFRHRSELA